MQPRAGAAPSVRETILWGERELKGLGPREALTNAERLLEEVLGQERTHLYLHGHEAVPDKALRQYRRLVEKRRQRIPLAYLLKKAYFWNEVLEVGRGCLIPRPETEILVDTFIRLSGFGKGEAFRFADVGSGSGAIGIAILRHFTRSEGFLLDASAVALAITKRNAARYKLQKRSKILKSNLLQRMSGKVLDAVISNPPYVAAPDWKKLEPEVLMEPKLALDGGKDGLFFYKKITEQAAGGILKPGGVICFELGYGLSKAVKKLLRKDFTQIEVIKDYNRIDRVIIARRKS